MYTSLLHEPDCELGYSKQQLVGILGGRMADFHDYMIMKTYVFDDRGAVYYPSDVHRYVEHMLPPRSAPLSRGQVAALLSGRDEPSTALKPPGTRSRLNSRNPESSRPSAYGPRGRRRSARDPHHEMGPMASDSSWYP